MRGFHSINQRKGTWFGRVLGALAVSFLLIGTAQAQLAGHSGSGADLGAPYNFPVWFQEGPSGIHNGVALRLCTAHEDPFNLICIFEPVDEANLYSVQTGFGAEAFWFAADGLIAIRPSAECTICAKGLLVMAIEAAYNLDAPLAGDEFTFGRLRIRIDAPYAGTYRVTHPYGVDEFVIDAPDARAINLSHDIGSFGPSFDGPLSAQSRITQFLSWDTTKGAPDDFGNLIFDPPAGLLGDPVVDHALKGSPFGTNFFRVEYIAGPLDKPWFRPGTCFDQVPSNPADPLSPMMCVDGPGLDPVVVGQDFVQRDTFAMQGLIFDGVLPTPLKVDRATYTDGRVELVVRSVSTATVRALLAVDTLPVDLVGDGNGTFFVSAPLPFHPATVRIQASNFLENFELTEKIAVVDDVVNVTRVDYDPTAIGGSIMVIEANSSHASGGPVLTAEGYGELVGGSLTILGMGAPPGSITVTSSMGGSDTEPVYITAANQGAPVPGANQPPLAGDDFLIVDEDIGGMITVTANDSDPDAPFDQVEPFTVALSSAPTNGVVTIDPVILTPGVVSYVPNANFFGIDSFSYTVRDSFGGISNVATVSVTINAVNDAPEAKFDEANTLLGTTVIIPVLANDNDIDSLIDPASIVIEAPALRGTTFVDILDGSISYTPNPGFSGLDSFRYSVADAEGLRSNTVDVLITVQAGATEIATIERAEFKEPDEWRVQGISNVTAANIVTVYKGGIGGPVVGTGLVDVSGAWSVNVRGSTLSAVNGDTVSIVTGEGTVVTGFPIKIK